MASNILPVFLSMALLASLMSFRESEQTTVQWLAFVYFVLNRVRYFYSDVPWDRLAAKCRQENLGLEQSLGLLFMVANLFFAVVVAMFIPQLMKYLLFSALNLAIGTVYLVFERFTLLDRSKDTGRVKLFNVQKEWIFFNISEIVIFLSAAFLYHSAFKITEYFKVSTVESFKVWTICVAFFLLFLIMLIDMSRHREFLFKQEEDT